MRQIEEESKKMKARIFDYQRLLTNQVEVYSSELMMKKEELEETRDKTCRWLRNSHVTDMVNYKQQKTDELVGNTEVELCCEFISKPAIFPKGML